MTTWKEIREGFESLHPRTQRADVQCQWGALPERLTLGGINDSGANIRFKGLARAAGDKLLQGHSDDLELPTEVLSETNSETRWYKALWHMEGGMSTEMPVIMGEKIGAAGRIRNVTDQSIALATRLGTKEAQPSSSSTVFNLTGPNSRINVDSVDLSSNSADSNLEVFQKLDQLIQNELPEELIASFQDLANSLKESHGTKGFNKKYQEFMAAAANHATVFAPILGPLAGLVS